MIYDIPIRASVGFSAGKWHDKLIIRVGLFTVISGQYSKEYQPCTSIFKLGGFFLVLMVFKVLESIHLR